MLRGDNPILSVLQVFRSRCLPQLIASSKSQPPRARSSLNASDIPSRYSSRARARARSDSRNRVVANRESNSTCALGSSPFPPAEMKPPPRASTPREKGRLFFMAENRSTPSPRPPLPPRPARPPLASSLPPSLPPRPPCRPCTAVPPGIGAELDSMKKDRFANARSTPLRTERRSWKACPFPRQTRSRRERRCKCRRGFPVAWNCLATRP